MSFFDPLGANQSNEEEEEIKPVKKEVATKKEEPKKEEPKKEIKSEPIKEPITTKTKETVSKSELFGESKSEVQSPKPIKVEQKKEVEPKKEIKSEPIKEPIPTKAKQPATTSTEKKDIKPKSSNPFLTDFDISHQIDDSTPLNVTRGGKDEADFFYYR